MKAYLAVTASLFGVLTLVHVWRVYAESSRLARDPWYVLMTMLAAGLCAWGCRLLFNTRPGR